MASTQKQLIFRLYWDFISSGFTGFHKSICEGFLFFFFSFMGKYSRLFPPWRVWVATHRDVWIKIYPTFVGMQGNKGRQSRNWADWLQWRQLTSESKAQEPLKTQAVAWQALAGRISPVAWGFPNSGKPSVHDVSTMNSLVFWKEMMAGTRQCCVAWYLSTFTNRQITWRSC